MFKKYLKVARPEVVKSGLVLWYDGHDFSNPASSATIRDRSGNSLDGTCTNFAYTAASGNSINEGIQFDGVNDIITRAYSASMTSTYFTLETKIRMATLPTITARLIMRGITTGTTTYALTITALGQVIVYINAVAVDYAITNLGLNAWYDIVAKIDGTNCTLFVNGVQDSATLSAATMPVTTDNMAIGNDTSYARYFNGQIKTVRVYNRALTNAEILQNYSVEVE
jgi:hypothetical protein